MKQNLFAGLREKGEGIRAAMRSVWLPVAVGTLVLAALIIVCSVVWQDYRTALIDSQTRQMELVVQSMADGIEFSLDEYADRLGAAVRKVEQDPSARPSLARSETIEDLWLEDQDGRIVYSCYGLTPVCDVLITQTEEISYWQYHEGDHHYLVLKQQAGELTACLVVDSEEMYKQLVADIQVGTNGYVMIKNATNMVVMHPEPAQWGIDVISGREALYSEHELDMTSLTELLTLQQEKSSGIQDYYSYWWTDPEVPRVHKVSAFCHLTVGDSFWIVSAVVDYDDLYQPIAQSFRKMAILFGVVAGVLVLFTILVSRLQDKAARNATEIRDLKSLNATLEELHRGEESLAHSQRLQLMGTLTGGIAHEFNNFLTPIMGYADIIMADAEPDTEIYDNALEISQAAQKAQDVVRQISSMSRKNVETVYDTVSVEKLIHDTRKLAETNCPKQIELREEINLDGECVLGNATQLQQVLLNICINGIHAIGQAEGSVTFRAETAFRSDLIERFAEEKIPEDWDTFVCITITDTGCGMARETLQHIFEPFFTTKKVGQGTGLGLSLAEQIIHTHRGQICAESTLGSGTTFFVYLPMLQSEQAQAQVQWALDQKVRILAADDNKKVLNLLEKDFGALGFEIVTCSRRGEVRTLLESRPFDVLAIDESLTGGSGIDFCMSIQGKYPGLTRLVMASTPTREILEARHHRVIDGYVIKPVSAATLLAELRACRREEEVV